MITETKRQNGDNKRDFKNGQYFFANEYWRLLTITISSVFISKKVLSIFKISNGQNFSVVFGYHYCLFFSV